MWWDGRQIVAQVDSQTTYNAPSSPLRRYLATLAKESDVAAEREAILRMQMIHDGIPPDRANLLCTENFDDIMADIMMDIIE